MSADTTEPKRSANPLPAPGEPSKTGQERPGLTPVAQRALAEADERRRAAARNDTKPAEEVGGRDGPEPTRYGDWEKNGIISDF